MVYEMVYERRPILTQLKGMYSRKSWGGDTDPYVMATFRGYQKQGEDDPNKDPLLGTVIFEYSDERFLGIPKTAGSDEVRITLGRLDEIKLIIPRCNTSATNKP